ncbi:MAG: tRNA dihydrouridine synthase DusB [Deltaproteobacteria bacterium]|nr:tRNA dihydrouridine synthase DusB [Deltaproteobacteria bacterium]
MKIGNLTLKNNVFLAPMAGITDLVFRTLARGYGCALCFTEMVSSNGLTRRTQRSYRYLESSVDDRPLGVQIFGADPDVIADAAHIVADMGADLIDINMGCPVKKVLKTGAGAALLKDPLRVGAVLRKVRASVDVPLTIKIRSGWERHGINAADIAAIAEDYGVDAVILHPRTVEQGFSGFADWELISMVKKRLTIPVIGSGDIRSAKDALRMLHVTGCDGIMVGRGALGNPWIFREIINSLASESMPLPVTIKEREEMMRRHLNMTIRDSGEDLGVKKFRKHLLWYTKGLKGGAQFRQSVVSVREKEFLLSAVHAYFSSLEEHDDMVI